MQYIETYSTLFYLCKSSNINILVECDLNKKPEHNIIKQLNKTRIIKCLFRLIFRICFFIGIVKSVLKTTLQIAF